MAVLPLPKKNNFKILFLICVRQLHYQVLRTIVIEWQDNLIITLTLNWIFVRPHKFLFVPCKASTTYGAPETLKYLLCLLGNPTLGDKQSASFKIAHCASDRDNQTFRTNQIIFRSALNLIRGSATQWQQRLWDYIEWQVKTFFTFQMTHLIINKLCSRFVWNPKKIFLFYLRLGFIQKIWVRI